MAVSQDQLARRLMAADLIEDQTHGLRHLYRHGFDRRLLLIVIEQPVEPSVGREIGRVFAICVLGGLQPAGR